MRMLIALALAAMAQVATQTPLDTLDRDIRAGAFGYVDALIVLRGNAPIVSHKYPRNYAEISRGRRSEIGRGEGCPDEAWMHHFNYLHPRWHPYYQGRDVHSLQSVTKSITALVVGIAHARGEISSLQQPFLEHFTAWDLSKVDPRLRKATIEDVLTMRSGIEWHESDRPLGDTNTTVQLERPAGGTTDISGGSRSVVTTTSGPGAASAASS